MISYLLYHATNIPPPFSEITRLYLRCRSDRRREGQDRRRGGVVLANFPPLLDSRLPAGPSAHHPRAVRRPDACQGRRQQVRSQHLVAPSCVIPLCHGPLFKRQRTVEIDMANFFTSVVMHIMCMMQVVHSAWCGRLQNGRQSWGARASPLAAGPLRGAGGIHDHPPAALAAATRLSLHQVCSKTLGYALRSCPSDPLVLTVSLSP